jgi:hypothetical protein
MQRVKQKSKTREEGNGTKDESRWERKKNAMRRARMFFFFTAAAAAAAAAAYFSICTYSAAA